MARKGAPSLGTPSWSLRDSRWFEFNQHMSRSPPARSSRRRRTGSTARISAAGSGIHRARKRPLQQPPVRAGV